MKVAASSLRKGAVVDVDGKLYVVLNVENIHPGKGTPVTQLDMRRIADGVKVSERYRTTESVERAFVDEREYTFLYRDGPEFHFMEPATYDQVTVREDMVGEAAVYLADGMVVTISLHEGVPIALDLPARATVEIVETEPAVKGPDGVRLVQARHAGQRRALHGPHLHHRRHPHRRDDRRRRLRGTRQGLRGHPAGGSCSFRSAGVHARSFSLAEDFGAARRCGRDARGTRGSRPTAGGSSFASRGPGPDGRRCAWRWRRGRGPRGRTRPGPAPSGS